MFHQDEVRDTTKSELRKDGAVLYGRDFNLRMLSLIAHHGLQINGHLFMEIYFCSYEKKDCQII